MYLRKIKNYTDGILLALGLGVFFVFVSGIAHAESAIVSGFSTDSTIQPGTIVKLDPKDSSKVEVASENDPTNVYGVVVSQSDTPFTLQNSTSTNQVYVATAGSYNVLVSNQNGTIKTGDYIALSAIDGVGMKADSHEQIVVGKALASFDGTNALTISTLKGSSSHQQVSIGVISVAITITHNPLQQSQSVNLPGFLLKATQTVTSKPVSVARIYIGFFILVICAVFSGVVLYGGVRSSLIAIGRNPLSKKSVIRGLFQVTLVAMTIFIIGLFAVYLLLIL